MRAPPGMQLFRDVPVVPVTGMARPKPRGGPIWPDFGRQVGARFCRDGRPADRRPVLPAAAALHPLDRPAVWGGFLIHQFGHLVGEQLTRLPQSLQERPDDLYLFTVQPGIGRDSLPGHVWDVLAWFGVRRWRVRLVDRPCLVRELRVAPQGEMLGRQPTSGSYLARLDAIAERNGLVPALATVVFVTRAGMVARGQGGHAGEGYLAQVLAGLGVRVIDPGALPLRDQLAAYAGATVLVFSEGSAQHGRCLLGWLPQDIHVLRRRSRRNTAITQLRARARTLQYHETVHGMLGTATGGARPRVDLAAALYDLGAVFRLFAGLGLNLAAVWDDHAYRAAVRADVAGWMAAHRVDDRQHAANLATLAAAGFADLSPTGAAPVAPLP
jgi:hypothetical protein